MNRRQRKKYNFVGMKTISSNIKISGFLKTMIVAGFLIGFLLVVLAVFAIQIGLDNDAGWGAGRVLMLKAGLTSIFISGLAAVLNKRLAGLEQQTTRVAEKFRQIDYSKRMVIFTVPVVSIVIASYVWSALPGLGSSTFNHYTLLAKAFKQHQLYLIEEPPPALLALEDPYNYIVRKEKGIESYPWDASLYNGKFYFYWGPAPSLLLTLLPNETLDHIRDVHLVLAFFCGLFVYSVLLSYSLWLKANKSLPPWLYGACILAVGMSAPTAQLLNSSRVYEVAISGCQFFFIGGLYWAFTAFTDESLSLPKILLAGLHWAFALGTRITIQPVILLATGMMLIYAVKQVKPLSLKTHLPIVLYLCTPLAIAAIGIGWYNWARFGSLLEFGLKYQLANVNYSIFHDSFSAGYIKDNLYNYFTHPIRISRTFPFLHSIENTFSNERLAGLAYLSPFFFFAGLFVGKFLRPHKSSGQTNVDPIGSWMPLVLAGSALISTLTILSFYFPTTRYGEDFMPLLLLLATASIGEGYRLFGKTKVTGNLYIIFIALVAFFSAAASSLVAFPSGKAKVVIGFIEGIYKSLGIH
jgi:hypothetical protein